METPFEKPPMEQPETTLKDKIKLSAKILSLEQGVALDDDYTLLTLKTQKERERFLKVLEDARETGDNRKRFWNMLVSTVEKAGYRPPQDRQTTVLDLACGKCEEGIVLSAFFGGGTFINSNENVKLIGVDIKKEDIGRAIRSYSRLVLPHNYKFITGDATNLDQYQQIPKEVDVVVIRHGQISDNEQIWTKIFQQAIQRVSGDGIIIITSFSDIEHRMLIEALHKFDCEIVIDESNPYAKSLSHKEISLDRNITIIRKKNLPQNLPAGRQGKT